MSPEELLAKAADEMSRTGQHKGTYYNSGKAMQQSQAPVCAYGAMARAATDGKWADYAQLGAGLAPGSLEAYALVNQAARLLAKTINADLMAAIEDPFGIVTRHNDDLRTSQEDMILAFKKAAAHD